MRFNGHTLPEQIEILKNEVLSIKFAQDSPVKDYGLADKFNIVLMKAKSLHELHGENATKNLLSFVAVKNIREVLANKDLNKSGKLKMIKKYLNI